MILDVDSDGDEEECHGGSTRLHRCVVKDLRGTGGILYTAYSCILSILRNQNMWPSDLRLHECTGCRYR